MIRILDQLDLVLPYSLSDETLNSMLRRQKNSRLHDGNASPINGNPISICRYVSLRNVTFCSFSAPSCGKYQSYSTGKRLLQ